LDAFPPAIEGLFEQRPMAIFRNFENIFVELADEDAVRGFARMRHISQSSFRWDWRPPAAERTTISFRDISRLGWAYRTTR
jgi:hypothetical protein